MTEAGLMEPVEAKKEMTEAGLMEPLNEEVGVKELTEDEDKV